MAAGSHKMNCPYCRKTLVVSKVDDTTWYCWHCAIMVTQDEGEDVDTIHTKVKNLLQQGTL